MTLVLDSGGVSALTGRRARLAELRRQGLWPPVVPAVVLVESLTGDHRRDHAANNVLGKCLIVAVEEPLAREAARLRYATGRAAQFTGTDAVVVAVAATLAEAEVLTGNPDDLTALAAHAESPVQIVAI